MAFRRRWATNPRTTGKPTPSNANADGSGTAVMLIRPTTVVVPVVDPCAPRSTLPADPPSADSIVKRNPSRVCLRRGELHEPRAGAARQRAAEDAIERDAVKRGRVEITRVKAPLSETGVVELEAVVNEPKLACVPPGVASTVEIPVLKVTVVLGSIDDVNVGVPGVAPPANVPVGRYVMERPVQSPLKGGDSRGPGPSRFEFSLFGSHCG